MLTASKREVVLYLYEGALGYIQRAVEAHQEEEESARNEAINRVISILIELSCCLDYNRNGSLALRLDSIYNYLIQALTISCRTGEPAALETAASVLTILGDAWRQAINMDKTIAERGNESQLQISV